MPICEPSHWDRMLYHLFEWLPGVCPGAGVRLFWGSFGFSQGYLVRWVTPWLCDWLIAWRERRSFERKRLAPSAQRNTFTFDANQVGTLLCSSLAQRLEPGRYQVWLTTRCDATALVDITVTLIEHPHGKLTVLPASTAPCPEESAHGL